MSNNVSSSQIKSARHADLYTFLIKYHNCSFSREGDSLRPKDNHSISIKKGYCGYKDFSSSETGNPIEYLMRHMNYTFVAAVQALAGESAAVHTPDSQQAGIRNVPPQFPPPINGRYKNLFAFLTNRGISAETIQMLVDHEILYQEKNRNNIVFINMEKDFAELRGTYTYGKPFHGIIPNSRHDGFWWFRTSKTATIGYICEAAIDAISLYELYKLHGNTKPAYYISIAGAAKQPTIDRLKKSSLSLILAVDNDAAGQQCRNRNLDLDYIFPKHKDWNEDLQAVKGQ